MKRLFLLLFVAPFLMALTGCGSSNPSTAQNNLDANGQPVSTVPWNKQESWESGGSLGTALGNH